MKIFSIFKSIIKLFLILIAVLFIHCGIYTFSGSTLPPHLKSVAVPLFENRTPEFGIDQELTDALIDAIIEDNTLKLVDYQDSDAVLRGQIIRVTDRAGQYSQSTNQAEEAKDYRVTISVNITFEDRLKKKTLWEESISQWGIYDFSEISREEGIQEALEKISIEIVNMTVSGW